MSEYKKSIDSDSGSDYKVGIIYQIEISNLSCPQCLKNSNYEGENRLINYKNSYRCCLSCGCLVIKQTDENLYSYVRTKV